MYRFSVKQKFNFKINIFILFIFFVFLIPFSVRALEIHPPSTSFIIGEFVYDDDYVATTTNCYINIWEPDGDPLVENTLMIANANGWHYYDFAGSATLGKFPANMTCGTAGIDLIKQDKTFIISNSSNLSVDDIASAVWSDEDRTLTDYATSTISSAIWNSPSRTLTSFGTLVSDIWTNGTRSLTTFGTLVSDIWTNGTRSLSSGILDTGENLATESYINTATSTIITEVLNNADLINNLNDISAADVWAYSTKDVTLSNPSQVWNVATSTITAVGSIGKQIVDNLDVMVSSRGTSTLTAADIWSASTRTLTDYSTSTISAAVWANAARELTNYGNDITAADVWNVLASTLNTEGTIGNQLSLVSTSTIATAVWDSPSRTLTSFGTLVADIWNNGTRSLTTFGTLVADVWNNGTRTLSSGTLSGGGTLATESYIDTATSTIISSINSETSGPWTVNMSNVSQILAGNQYRVKVYTYNVGQLANSFASPQITIYDANRNVVVSGVAITNLSNGIYEYVYTVAGGAAQGAWETVINTEVEAGQTTTISDYWEVRGSPAQVIINSISDVTIPSISADVIITNEGSGGYEYHYEWCVVSSINNVCGGGDDVFYGSAAKYILSGENWNTSLSATVPGAGDYYFKLVVYFGTESSGASRSFTATNPVVMFCGDGACNNGETCSTCASDCGQCGGGGGGGGGGTESPITPPLTPTTTPTTTPPTDNHRTADLNRDRRVDSIDFSILLYFWKTLPPYRNIYVDINKDNKVSSVDFSIMLFQWTGRNSY